MSRSSGRRFTVYDCCNADSGRVFGFFLSSDLNAFFRGNFYRGQIFFIDTNICSGNP